MAVEKSTKLLNVDLAKAKPVGQNLKVEQVDKYLVIVVDTTVDLGASKSGKMNAVAQTNGFTDLGIANLRGNLYIGVHN